MCSADREGFPTEQRTRQKERKKAGHVAKKLPQTVEDHHDDCGEDFGPLGEDFFADDPFDGMEEVTSDSEDETFCVCASDLAQPEHANGSPMDFEDLESFIT